MKIPPIQDADNLGKENDRGVSRINIYFRIRVLKTIIEIFDGIYQEEKRRKNTCKYCKLTEERE